MFKDIALCSETTGDKAFPGDASLLLQSQLVFQYVELDCKTEPGK